MLLITVISINILMFIIYNRKWKKHWFSLYYDDPNKGFKIIDNKDLQISSGVNKENNTATYDNMHRSMLNQEIIGEFSNILKWVMDKEATKTNGILEIANVFDISKDEIIAFGVDINDKEMLLNFGLGVAMGNSLDEVKMIADYICDNRYLMLK